MSSTRSPDETSPSPAVAATDRDLLTKFVRQGDGEAFAEIVRRYSPLVLGVCGRVLHDRHAAEDAFQATFLVLAQSARRIRKQRSLSSWLHGVAYRISLRALAQRHRRREQPAVMETVTVEPALEHVGNAYEQQLLDQELQELPEQYRAPLVMHYLEGQSRQEIADRLGVSLSAVEGRLKRGKKELRLRLLRHGVPMAAIVATVHFTQSTVNAAAISTLVAETTKAALAAASGTLTTSAATSNAAVLAGKELSTMAASKLFVTLGLSTAALALVLIGAGVAGTGGANVALLDGPPLVNAVLPAFA
jgi:RNA polymerase sigma factor (sigma-70 family)